jgi:hypothetical protein
MSMNWSDFLLDVARGMFIGALTGCILIWLHRRRLKRQEEKERKAMRELLLHVSQRIGDED